MIDRTKYFASFNIPPIDLIEEWNRSLPTGEAVEKFLSDEVGEETESEYFIATSDLLLDVVKRQEAIERERSLAVLYTRLIDGAALVNRGIDKELETHFRSSLNGFAEIYREYYDQSDFDKQETSLFERLARTGCLVVAAIVMNDLPLARMIANPKREMLCSNPECQNDELLSCPECNSTIVPYEFYVRRSLA